MDLQPPWEPVSNLRDLASTLGTSTTPGTCTHNTPPPHSLLALQEQGLRVGLGA